MPSKGADTFNIAHGSPLYQGPSRYFKHQNQTAQTKTNKSPLSVHAPSCQKEKKKIDFFLK